MFKLIIQLYRLLTITQRKRFYKLQLLVIVMAGAEVWTVACIAGYMGLVANMSLINTNHAVSFLYHMSHASSPSLFLFDLGCVVFLIIMLSEIFCVRTVWALSLFAADVGSEIGDTLYTYYMQQSWLFHASGNSAQLVKHISNEALRVSDQIINPLMQMNARVVLSIAMIMAMLVFNPTIVLTGFFLFALIALALHKVVRPHLIKQGVKISDLLTLRFQLMSEGFGGIKDVLVLGRKFHFIHRFVKSGRDYAHARALIATLSQVPKYFIEFISFASAILLVLYLIRCYSGDLALVLPVLAVYAIAGFKLLPAFQIIFLSMAIVNGNRAAFDLIQDDVLEGKKHHDAPAVEPAKDLSLHHAIELKNITFTYPHKRQPALDHLTLTIPRHHVIGLIGASGSGKSTVVDILLGLLQPDEGSFIVDGHPVARSDLRSWQNILGFVPQNIFLADASIAENIAFGLSDVDIDHARVRRALKLAHLDEFVTQLPEGLRTRVGERGVQLSGGQRQRIGIARALYDDAQVLIFDEATSALDGLTERLIMESMDELAGQKTIILIAHRLATVKKCDNIYVLDQGRVIAEGSYTELLASSEVFQNMALHA